MISISLVIQRVLTAASGSWSWSAGGGLIAVSIVFTLGAVTGFLIATQVLRRYIVAAALGASTARAGCRCSGRASRSASRASLFVILMRVDATLLGFLTGGDDNSEVGIYGAAFRLVEGTLFISWAVGRLGAPVAVARRPRLRTSRAATSSG